VSDPKSLKPAYLIIGNDVSKLRRAVARLRARVVAEAGNDLNVAVFDADMHPVDDVVEAASMPGFTFGTRLLLVLNAHKWPAKVHETLAAYVRDPLPDTCLAIEAESFAVSKDALRKAGDPLRKAIGAAGEILTYDLPKKYEMTGWVRKQATVHGLSMGQAVAHHFLERCGGDPEHSERLEREIEKLAAYCRGHEATMEDVDAVCSPDDEASIFNLMDAIGGRDAARAFALLEMVFNAGEDPNKILYMLVKRMEQIEAAANADTRDAGELAKSIGVPFWTAKRLAEQATHYDSARLNRATKALAGAMVGMRGRAPATLETEAGVNHTDRLVLELALARLLS
jgi:DNA polymerase-3 subunit delta